MKQCSIFQFEFAIKMKILNRYPCIYLNSSIFYFGLGYDFKLCLFMNTCSQIRMKPLKFQEMKICFAGGNTNTLPLYYYKEKYHRFQEP